MPSTAGSWMSVDAAAKALGRSTDTVRRLIKAGRLEAYKVGEAKFSHIRITEQSVINLLDASRIRPAAPRRPAGRRLIITDAQGDIFSVPDDRAA